MAELTELTCPNCGAKLEPPSDPDQALCPYCGTELAVAAGRGVVAVCPAPPALKCPSCRTENEPDATFCQSCGQHLLPRCPRCDVSNTRGAEFCKNCGIKLAEATVGIRPERAKQWARFFKSCGYLPLSFEWQDWFNGLCRTMGMPSLGQNDEVIVVALEVNKKSPLGALWVEIHYGPNHETRPGKVWRANYGFDLFTSWRLFHVGLPGGESFWAPYGVLSGISVRDRRISLQATTGTAIHIQLRAYRQSLSGKFFWAAGTDSTYWGQVRLEELDLERRSAAGVGGLETFFGEVVALANEWSDRTESD